MALFEVRELISMAVKDEETGIAFYRGLAESTNSDTVKQRCQEISEQEKQHRSRFESMLDELGDIEPVEEYPGQYERYVQNLLETRAFPEPKDAEEDARSCESDAEAIDTAMRLEKDTLLFLQEMRRFVPDTHTDYVDDVVQEERDHLSDLTELKKQIA